MVKDVFTVFIEGLNRQYEKLGMPQLQNIHNASETARWDNVVVERVRQSLCLNHIARITRLNRFLGMQVQASSYSPRVCSGGLELTSRSEWHIRKILTDILMDDITPLTFRVLGIRLLEKNASIENTSLLAESERLDLSVLSIRDPWVNYDELAHNIIPIVSAGRSIPH